MSRYIDADKLLKGYEDHELISTHLIWNAPTADVVEVRHGEWIYGESEEGHDGYRCSECGEFIPWEYDEYDIDFIKKVHYCPNCGARMDGESK